MPSIYDTLNGGSRFKLDILRSYAQRWNSDPRKSTQITWRDARRHGVAKLHTDAHGPRFSEDGESAALPLSVIDSLREVPESEVKRAAYITHNGWYADADRDQTYNARVWRLPGRDGAERYIAGYGDALDGDYVVLCARGGQLRVFTSLPDAARDADHLAEDDARECREYSDRWSEASTHDGDRDGERYQLRDTRKKVSALIWSLRGLRTAGKGQGPQWEQVVTMLRELRHEMRETLREIARHTEAIAALGLSEEFPK